MVKIQEVIQRLNEAVVDIGPIKGVRDGHVNQVLSWWRRSQFREIRGLYSGEQIFWWDAEMMTHDEASGHLGIENAGRLVITSTVDGKPFMDVTPWDAVLDGSPKWDRYLGHYELLFYSPTLWHCTGAQLVAEHKDRV